jgi:hypothetical protein
MTIRSCGAVIDSKVVTGTLSIWASNGTHSSATPCVIVKNSLINGLVTSGYAAQGYGPLVLTDDEIVGTPGSGVGPLQEANFYGWRLNIHGGRGQVACDGFCELHDSYVHDAFFFDGEHYQAFEDNGNYGNPILVDHNTLVCRFTNTSNGNGGCASDISFFGDNSPISNVVVSNNLLQADPFEEYWCAYTGAAQPSKPYPTGSNLQWVNNTFERGSGGQCGGAGPVYDWASGNGNVWSGNVWDSGGAVTP